jgi:hypothetical protein
MAKHGKKRQENKPKPEQELKNESLAGIAVHLHNNT